MRMKFSEKAICDLLIAYFAVLFFYGVIIKITFPFNILFQLKTILPEMILVCVCALCLLKKRHVDKLSLLVLGYMVAIFIINIVTSFSANSFMMTFRDVFIPLCVAFFLMSTKMDAGTYEYFFKRMCVLCIIAILAGGALGIVQYQNGWKWTSAWYTGYSFWGEDTKSSLYIMTSNAKVRVPSIIGHNVKFGMSSFFQGLLILCHYQTNGKLWKKILKCVTVGVAVVNIYISNNKTTLVICIVLFALWLMKRMKKYEKAILGIMFLVLGLYLYYQIQYSSDFLLSFYDRFSKWSSLSTKELMINLIVPFSTFNFAGNSGNVISVLNYWDNTYLYFAFAYGIIGCILILLWIKQLHTKANRIAKLESQREFVHNMTIFTMFAALTTSIVLGRCFFNIYIIILAFVSNKYSKTDWSN